MGFRGGRLGGGGHFGAGGEDPPPIPKERRARTIRRIAAFFLPYRRQVAIVLGAILLTSLIGLVNPILLKLLIDIAIPELDFGLLNLFVGLMILLPDMPDIADHDLAALLDVFADDPLTPVRAASASGRAGHPVILPHRLFPGLLVLTGDEGARRVLAGEDVNLVPLEGDRAVTDLDTPEEWAAWRASRPGPS